MEIKEKLPGVQENVNLDKYTTFKTGGPARYFYTADSKSNLAKAVNAARKMKLPFFILGGGSNILMPDAGFPGLVIKNEAAGFKINEDRIVAESGALLSVVVKASIKAGLSGLVEAAGIPGTMGGAVYGNAGGQRETWAIGDYIEEAEILPVSGKTEKVGKEWFGFEYRASRLRSEKEEKPVILEITLKLNKGDKEDLETRFQEIIVVKASKIPPGFSAGSVFKNPKGEFAGSLIEKCGLRGKKIGDAQISEKHANFILNLGKAKSKDILELISLAKEKVKEKFNIELEEEIQIIS